MSTLQFTGREAEFIGKVIAKLKSGWTQYAYQRYIATDKACYCVLGAMNSTARGSHDGSVTPWGSDPYYTEFWTVKQIADEVVNELLTDEDTFKGWSNLAEFNDNVAVDVTQVIDVLNMAKERIAAELYPIY